MKFDVLVADGARAYPKALRQHGKNCYFVRHIHNHPWDRSEIHKIEILQDRSVRHVIVDLRYDVLVQAEEKPQHGYALGKRYPAKVKGRGRGRPKGSRNKRKRKVKKAKQRRGSKTPSKTGKAFVLNSTE